MGVPTRNQPGDVGSELGGSALDQRPQTVHGFQRALHQRWQGQWTHPGHDINRRRLMTFIAIQRHPRPPCHRQVPGTPHQRRHRVTPHRWRHMSSYLWLERVMVAHCHHMQNTKSCMWLNKCWQYLPAGDTSVACTASLVHAKHEATLQVHSRGTLSYAMVPFWRRKSHTVHAEVTHTDLRSYAQHIKQACQDKVIRWLGNQVFNRVATHREKATHVCVWPVGC